MKYNKTVILRDGRACLLRNADENDTAKVLEGLARHASTHAAGVTL